MPKSSKGPGMIKKTRLRVICFRLDEQTDQRIRRRLGWRYPTRSGFVRAAILELLITREARDVMRGLSKKFEAKHEEGSSYDGTCRCTGPRSSLSFIRPRSGRRGWRRSRWRGSWGQFRRRRGAGAGGSGNENTDRGAQVAGSAKGARNTKIPSSIGLPQKRGRR
jgi:Arc/MetJ-type ribon-helix-helix transcriptional regulator